MKKSGILNQYKLFLKSIFGFFKKKNYPLLIPFLIGSAIRILFVLSNDFPINDGGMFYTMVNDIKINNFALPIYTSYNHSNIPFAYPPLSFYLTAFLSDLLPIPLIQFFRFLPLIFSILTILVFFKFTEKLFSKEIAFYSAIAFSLLPRSFEWQIMGGGLARSLGFLLSLLTLFYVTKLFNKPDINNVLLAAVLFSLTALSHLSWAFFTFVSSFFICLLKKGGKRNSHYLIYIFSAAFLFLLPWLAMIISRYGLQTFINFAGCGISFVSLEGSANLTANRLQEITLSTFLLITGLLFVAGLFKKYFVVSVWLLVYFVITPRSAVNLVVAPTAILIGLSINEVMVMVSESAKISQKRLSFSGFKRTVFNISLLTIFLYFIASVASTDVLYHLYIAKSLSIGQRDAMSWISKNTPLSSKFLLINDDVNWATDASSEWFPALSERISITTPQGTEWLADNEFDHRVAFYNNTRKECADTGVGCIENVVYEFNQTLDYLYVSRNLSENEENILYQSISDSADYGLVYMNPEVEIYERI